MILGGYAFELAKHDKEDFRNFSKSGRTLAILAIVIGAVSFILIELMDAGIIGY